MKQSKQTQKAKDRVVTVSKSRLKLKHRLERLLLRYLSSLSPGYTLALSGSGTDQRSVPTDPQERHQSGEGEEDRPRLTLDRAVYPQLSTVQSRLATFKNWPLADLFSPQMLVMLGFFFAGKEEEIKS